MKYSEELEDIVAGANVAGYLEAEGKIFIDTDEELTNFLITIYNAWFEDYDCKLNFLEYAAQELMEKFGVESSG